MAVPTPTGVAAPASVTTQRSVNPLRWLVEHLPEGHGLPEEEWRVRHKAVVFIILGHAVGLAIFGLVQHWGSVYALGESAIIALLGAVAAAPVLSRKMRAAVAALGCVTASAVLVQFSGGVIEAHFHFFVVVALISLYQDWVPFLLCIGFVAIDHGLAGALAPAWVYNHAGAIDHPWKWAVIHAVMVLAECVALVVVWHSNEKARAETERVLRSAGEGLVGTDSSGRVTFANPAAVRLVGGRTNDIVGHPLHMLLEGADGRPLFGTAQAMAQANAFTTQAWLAAGAAQRTPVEVLWNPIVGRTHAAEGAVVSMRDISERLRSEEERRKAAVRAAEMQQLREMSDMKTQFLNMAAHELNTPLTPITVQLHVLKQRAARPPLLAHQESIQLLDRNFKRLSGLVQDLLVSTQLQSAHLPVRPQQLDLASVLAEASASFGPAAAERGVQVEVVCPLGIGLRADPERLAQALGNLVTNALKFTPTGGRVRLEGRDTGLGVRIEVRDSGVGMTPQQISRLFMPFSQVHESQVAGHHGSGLGLYISRGIAELHGGRLWAESMGPGHGSAFVLVLPKAGPQATEPIVAAA